MTTKIDVSAVPKKIALLEDELNSLFVERSAVIRAATIAMVTPAHLFMVGIPGVAKSQLVRELVRRIDGFDPGDYFELLFTKTTVPEEIFGPPDLPLLRDTGEYRRRTEHMLPEAKVFFGDEWWRAGSTAVNSLLTIMNEGLYHNGGTIIKTPLKLVFAASNSIPEDDNDLHAIWDRLTFRLRVNPIVERGSFLRLLRTEFPEDPEPVISWAEILQAHQAVKNIQIPDEVFDALADLREKLYDEGIEPSDRRFRQCVPIIRATAFLDSRDTARIEDLRTLSDVLWTKEEFIPIVQRLCLDLAAPLDRKALLIIDTAGELTRQTREALKTWGGGSDADQVQLEDLGSEILGKMRELRREFRELRAEADQENYRSEKIAEAKQAVLSLGELLKERVFNLPANRSRLEEEL